MRKGLGFVLVFSMVLAAGCTRVTEQETEEGTAALADVPYYFIAVHNEPYHIEQGGEAKVAEAYQVLQQMIKKADAYNIKLTLMFSAQWSDHVLGSSARLAEVKGWQKNGHEISSHHHSIYHGNWDGYSDYTSQQAEAQRKKQNKKPEKYLGTLKDYWGKLQKLDPNVRSGCANDEADKKALPDGVVYDTCSGFANYGPVGQRAEDRSAIKGKNEYATVGTYRGVERTWLTHFQITTDTRQQEAQKVFATMDSATVYGSVTHSVQSQAGPFYSFLEYLHARDPKGVMSRTVSQVVEQGLLQEKTISSELVNKLYVAAPSPNGGQPGGNKKCGDGVCDAVEKANPKMCPKDCK